VRRSQAGTAIIEVTWLTLLLLVPLIYLVLSVFEVQRAAFGVDAAARAAGRAYVLAPDQVTAQARAGQAAAVAMRDQGISLDPGALHLSCTPHPDSCLSPGSTVTVRLQTQVRLPLLPDWFGAFDPTVRVTGEHRASYGTFREARP
jgi:Flp pilus assembly protein TadG